MRTRASYDTSLKHLYRKGLEDAIPVSLRKSIPRNTIHRWRHESDNKYLGCELNELAKSEIEMLNRKVYIYTQCSLLGTLLRRIEIIGKALLNWKTSEI